MTEINKHDAPPGCIAVAGFNWCQGCKFNTWHNGCTYRGEIGCGPVRRQDKQHVIFIDAPNPALEQAKARVTVYLEKVEEYYPNENVIDEDFYKSKTWVLLASDLRLLLENVK